MMKIHTDDVLRWQYPVLRDFFYHYVTYKELIKNRENLTGSLCFWKFTIDAHFKEAINNWCMVFGAWNNSTHFKHVKFEENIDDPFKPYMLKELNLTEEAYTELHNEITDFRNKFTAHREINFNERVPYLDIAYNVAVTYDLWVGKYVIFSDSLEMIIQNYREELQKTIENLSS